MTNVPTLDGVLEFILLATIPPFVIAFFIHYARYRKVSKALIVGVLSLELLIVISILFLILGLKNAGGVSGLLAGIIGLFVYPTPPVKAIELKDIRNINKKQVRTIIVICTLLLSMQIYYSYSETSLNFHVNDPENDLIYAGYYEKLKTEDKSIDIISMTSRLEGDNVILEMELAENADRSNAEYKFYISTHESNFDASRWAVSTGARVSQDDFRILQAEIPLDSLENRDVYQVLAVSSKYDEKTDMDIIDNCSSETIVRKILKRIFF